MKKRHLVIWFLLLAAPCAFAYYEQRPRVQRQKAVPQTGGILKVEGPFFP